MAYQQHTPDTPLGCMRDYDLVVYTVDDLNAIAAIETCLNGLTSREHKRELRQMIEHYHSSMRLSPFIDSFNSCPDNTGCPCTKLDRHDEPDCMHAGYFDLGRFRVRYMESHCLICYTRNCEGEICDHQVLYDDCVKVLHTQIGLLHAKEDELHIAGNTPYTELLEHYTDTDKTQREWEDEHSWFNNLLVDSWPDWVREAQARLDDFKLVGLRQKKSLAMAMGQHSRLGAQSSTNMLNPEMLAMVSRYY
jgi:hypothetical protein